MGAAGGGLQAATSICQAGFAMAHCSGPRCHSPKGLLESLVFSLVNWGTAEGISGSCLTYWAIQQLKILLQSEVEGPGMFKGMELGHRNRAGYRIVMGAVFAQCPNPKHTGDQFPMHPGTRNDWLLKSRSLLDFMLSHQGRQHGRVPPEWSARVAQESVSFI